MVPCTALLVHLATLGQAPVPTPASTDDFEPCDGVFSIQSSPDPYYLAVRDALLDESSDRRSQLVAIPSFSQEWCVYVSREEGALPRIVTASARRHIWEEMLDVISDHHRKSSYSIGSKAQAAALRQMEIQVDRAMVDIPGSLADQLDELWSATLDRVRYPRVTSAGCDGTTYHAAHWSPGVLQCGQIWSPSEGSRADAFVSIAEEMRALALAPPGVRAKREADLEKAARELLARVRKATQDELERK
jgi:hypothetical protein